MNTLTVVTQHQGQLLDLNEATYQQSHDEWLQAQWEDATLAWLQAKRAKSGSAQTQRAYEGSLRSFVQFIEHNRTSPTSGLPVRIWEVAGADVIAWQESMRKARLASATINLRLAAVSSFFKFVSTQHSLLNPTTKREVFLVDRNPVARAEREKVIAFGKVYGLDEQQVIAMLRRGCNKATVVGLRNHALIATYITTGRRCNEILQLRWDDLIERDGVTFYRWFGKGGKGGRRERGDNGILSELPQYAHEAISDYLKAAGRLVGMKPDEYIFIAHSDVALRLAAVSRAGWREGNKPLSSAMVNRIVKTAARRAGLDPSKVHTHTLRHAYGLWRLRMRGGDIEGLRQDMGHANVNTTQIYVAELDHPRDPLWADVQAFFNKV